MQYKVLYLLGRTTDSFKKFHRIVLFCRKLTFFKVLCNIVVPVLAYNTIFEAQIQDSKQKTQRIRKTPHTFNHN